MPLNSRANASKRTKLIQAVYVPRFMRGIVRRSMQDCLDAVHKAQHVGDGGCFSVQILDAFALRLIEKDLHFISESRKLCASI